MPRQSIEFYLVTCYPLPLVPETEGQNQDVVADHGVSVAAQSESCRGTSVKCSAKFFKLLTIGHPIYVRPLVDYLQNLRHGQLQPQLG